MPDTRAREREGGRGREGGREGGRERECVCVCVCGCARARACVTEHTRRFNIPARLWTGETLLRCAAFSPHGQVAHTCMYAIRACERCAGCSQKRVRRCAWRQTRAGAWQTGEACSAHNEDKPSTPRTYNQVFEVALGDGRVHFGEVDAFGLVVWWRYTRRAVLVLGPSLQANKQYLRAFQAEAPWSVRAVAPTTGVRRAQRTCGCCYEQCRRAPCRLGRRRSSQSFSSFSLRP